VDAISLKELRMNVCTNTGVSVPECSCKACLQAQIERHRPSLPIDAAGPRIEGAAEPIASPSLGESPTRRRAILARLRRARVRRVA
jgi:hypothetical protein